MISHDKRCKCDLEFAEDCFWKHSPVGVCLSSSQRLSHICHMWETHSDVHAHTRFNLETAARLSCRRLCWWPQRISTIYEADAATETDVQTRWHTRRWEEQQSRGLFSLGRLFFFLINLINKQLNMSVPPKSHQQSVRNTISREMRSIYSVSPEATSPAQTCITYYISAIAAAAGHGGGKSGPLQGKDCLEMCLFTDDWTKALSYNAVNRELKLRLPVSNHITVKDPDVIRTEDYFWVLKYCSNATVTKFGNSRGWKQAARKTKPHFTLLFWHH